MINYILLLYNWLFTIYALVCFLIPFKSQKVKDRLVLSNKDIDHPTVLIHGASVGELMSCQCLVEQLKTLNLNIIITSHTTTSKSVAESILNCLHHYLPYDAKFLIKKFIKKYQPQLVLWIEQDFFPNMLTELHTCNTPILLLNARISDKSFTLWKHFPKAISHIFNQFTDIFPMSTTNKIKIDILSNRDNMLLGNLKYTNTIATSIEEKTRKLLLPLVKNKRVWLALSTHPNEEEMIFRIHAKLQHEFNDIVTIIMPRHPHRCQQLAKIFQQQYNRTIPLYSKYHKNPYDTDILLVDTMGHAKMISALSDIVFIGKTLSTKYKGGQNLLEPLSMGCCVLFGENMSVFQDIATDCIVNNAGMTIKDENHLYDTIKYLFNNQSDLLLMQHNANFVSKNAQQVLNAFMEKIKCYINF